MIVYLTFSSNDVVKENPLYNVAKEKNSVFILFRGLLLTYFAIFLPLKKKKKNPRRPVSCNVSLNYIFVIKKFKNVTVQRLDSCRYHGVPL